MLGYDVFQVANEGKMVCVVPADQADAALEAMKAALPLTARMPPSSGNPGSAPRPRAEGLSGNGLRNEAHLDMLVGEQLPRIC